MPPKRKTRTTSVQKATPKAAPKRGASKSAPKKTASKKVEPAPSKKQKTTAKATTTKRGGKKAKSPSPDPVPQKKLSAKKQAKVERKKSEPEIVKVVTKGGAAVDQYVPGKDKYKVYQANGQIYSATLNKSDLNANNNKFYMIQVLQNESNGQLMVFNRWGRVGVPGQQAFKGPFPAPTAIAEYNKKFRDKTGGGYIPLEIALDDGGDEGESKTKKGSKKQPVKKAASKIETGVQDLMKLIFDMNMIKSSMKEIGYDAKKCPLGKLGDNTIKQAYGVLGELSKAIEKKKGLETYKQISGRFYSLIPHDFGFQKMATFVLDNGEKVKQKMDMLQSLTDMKLATKIIEQGEEGEESQIDKNYKSLNNNIKEVKPGSKEHKAIMDYIKDSGSARKVKRIYSLYRDNDEKRYNKKIGNDQLLWHGSRLQNYGGILSQGLRIAPPEAPVNGYVYGKGVYFANAFNTSDSYSYNYNTVGRPGPLLKVVNSGPCIDTKKYDTCLGYSRQHLPEKCYTSLDGLKVPSKSAKMAQNAYIVYNVNQATLRYLIWYER